MPKHRAARRKRSVNPDSLPATMQGIPLDASA